MFDPTQSHWLQEPQPINPQPKRNWVWWVNATCICLACMSAIYLLLAVVQ